MKTVHFNMTSLGNQVKSSPTCVSAKSCNQSQWTSVVLQNTLVISSNDGANVGVAKILILCGSVSSLHNRIQHEGMQTGYLGGEDIVALFEKVLQASGHNLVCSLTLQ